MQKLHQKRLEQRLKRLPFSWQSISSSDGKLSPYKLNELRFRIGQWQFECAFRDKDTPPFIEKALGSYSQEKEKGYIPQTFQGCDSERNRFYVPPISEEEYFQQFYQMGYSKGVARLLSQKSVYDTLKRYQDCMDGRLAFVLFVVKATSFCLGEDSTEMETEGWLASATTSFYLGESSKLEMKTGGWQESNMEAKYVASMIYEMALRMINEKKTEMPVIDILPALPIG